MPTRPTSLQRSSRVGCRPISVNDTITIGALTFKALSAVLLTMLRPASIPTNCDVTIKRYPTSTNLFLKRPAHLSNLIRFFMNILLKP